MVKYSTKINDDNIFNTELVFITSVQRLIVLVNVSIVRPFSP
jgi:hypothetical protein